VEHDDLARQAVNATEGLLSAAIVAVRRKVTAGGKLSAAQIEEVRLRARPYLEAFDYKSFV